MPKKSWGDANKKLRIIAGITSESNGTGYKDITKDKYYSPDPQLAEPRQRNPELHEIAGTGRRRFRQRKAQQARDDIESEQQAMNNMMWSEIEEENRPMTSSERARGYKRGAKPRKPRMDWDARFGVDADPNSMYEQGSWGQFRDAGSVYARQKLRGAPRGAARLGFRGAQRGAELGWRGAQKGAELGWRGTKASYEELLKADQALGRGLQYGVVNPLKVGAKYGVVDPLRRAGGMISAADAIALQGISNVRRSGQRLGTAERGSQYLGLQKGAITHTLPQSTGALNGVMRGLAGLFILFIFISVFYMVFGPLYDVLITNFLLIAGADGSTMLGGKDIAVLYANTANAILIWVPLIVIGGTLYLLISMVFERESKGLAGSNIMTEWDVFGGMEDDSNLDIALDGGIDEPMGLYGPS